MPISSIASAAINACGIESLLFAESSKLLSNHWVASTIAGEIDSAIINLESDDILSLLIGFLLYAIADEPICFFSNGSSNSLRCWSNLISLVILCILWAIPANTFKTWESNFLVYVCPLTA